MKWLVARSYCLLIALCIAATSGVVLAQSSAGPDTQKVVQAGRTKGWLTCRDNYMEPGSYEQCNISFSKRQIEQGDDHRLVAVWRPLRPMHLSRFVAGDSATYYARKFDNHEWWYNAFTYAGFGLLISGAVASKGCVFRECKHDSNGTLARTGTYVGAGLVLVSIPIRLTGRRAAYKAVDFWNASLKRATP
jgi:hypothetical protein